VGLTQPSEDPCLFSFHCSTRHWIDPES